MNLKGLNNAWLSPSGAFVTHDREFDGDSAGWHDQLAYRILRDIWEFDSWWDAFNKVHKKYSNYGYCELEELGWIRLHGFGGLKPVWVAKEEKLTKAQELAILGWCLENEVSYNECFSK